MSRLEPITMLIAQVGPTELFVPDATPASGYDLTGWMLWIAGVGLIAIGWVWMRTIQHKKVDARELAFRSLSKRMGLSSDQVRAIREMSKARKAHPIALLMCPSAIRSTETR